MPRGPRSIRTRILAAFVLSLATFTGALGYGLVQLRSIGEGLAAIDAAYVPLTGVAAELELLVRQMDRTYDRLAREDAPRPPTSTRSQADLYDTPMADALRRGRSTAATALDHVGDPDERAAIAQAIDLLDELDSQRQAYSVAFQSWATAATDATGDKSHSGRSLADLDSRRAELAFQVGQLSDLLERRMETVSARTVRAQTRAFAVSGTLAALAVLLATFLAGVALFSLRPIELLTGQVQRLAAGDYAGRVDVRASDEVGLLAREFNAMAEAVAERDRRLVERAEALDRLSLRLRQVLDTIHAGLVVAERGSAEMVNPAAEALWSVRPGEALPAPLASLEPGRYQALTLGRRAFDVEVVPFGARGSLIVGEDVTERNRDRDRLARSERLALVGQMLAQITHEVRNPLNAMSLHAELLAEDLEDPEARSLMATITSEISRLEALTARYLELSRGRRPELTLADPFELVREVIRLEQPGLERAGVTAEVRGERLGVVEMDADAMRRALRNVFRNAVEAGARTIDVALARDPDQVRIAVSDDGPGLDEDQLEAIFEPFFTTKSRGTGLGLAISRQELEDVGGYIRCESAPGKGSRFVLAVPVNVGG